MHKLREVEAEVNETHSGLGRFLTFNLLCAYANQCVMNVAVAGIGKSTCTWALKEVFGDNAIILDSITRSGFKYIADELTGFDGVVIVDDLGKVDTQYSRMATVTSFAELVYSHFIKKMTYTIEITINDFHGAALMNIQPVLMELMTNRPEWEAVIRDKTIRYYHLQRPLSPRKHHPRLIVPERVNLDTINFEIDPGAAYFELLQIGLAQWSYARTVEHIDDLVRAAAMLDSRDHVIIEDMEVVKHLILPMLLERWYFKKFAFESHIHFDDDAMCIMTELASFKNTSINQVCTDYKVTPQTCYSLLKNVEEWAIVNKGHVEPTEQCCEVLESIGFKLAVCGERRDQKKLDEEECENGIVDECIEREEERIWRKVWK